MTNLDKKLTKILVDHVDFGVRSKTMWVTDMIPALKSLIKETALEAIETKFETINKFYEAKNPLTALRHQQRQTLTKLLEEK